MIEVQSRWDSHEYDEISGSCGYCGDPAKIVTTVVFGQPMPDVVTVVDAGGLRVCGDCVKPALWLAMTERDPAKHAVRVVPLRSAMSVEDRRWVSRDQAVERHLDAAGG